MPVGVNASANEPSPPDDVLTITSSNMPVCDAEVRKLNVSVGAGVKPFVRMISNVPPSVAAPVILSRSKLEADASSICSRPDEACV